MRRRLLLAVWTTADIEDLAGDEVGRVVCKECDCARDVVWGSDPTDGHGEPEGLDVFVE